MFQTTNQISWNGTHFEKEMDQDGIRLYNYLKSAGKKNQEMESKMFGMMAG